MIRFFRIIVTSTHQALYKWADFLSNAGIDNEQASNIKLCFQASILLLAVYNSDPITGVS